MREGRGPGQAGLTAAFLRGKGFAFNEGGCKFSAKLKFEHKCFKEETPVQKGSTPVHLERMLGYLYYVNTRIGGQHSFCFRILAMVTEFSSVLKKIRSTQEHLKVVLEKLLKEVQLGRMLGPSPPMANLVVLPWGVGPKKEANKFCLLHHLGHQ